MAAAFPPVSPGRVVAVGSKLRRQLREVLPPEIKGLPRAVALEIADDARWDDGWRYNPDGGRRSKASLTDLVRWTAAKNERVIGDALRTLALAGWEFRVPFGKGKDGRPLYAVPGRAVEFRVPDFEVTEGPVTTGPSVEGPVTTAEGPVVTAEGPVTTGAGPVTTGPPSHVPSTSHQDPPSSPTEPDVPEPPDAPDVTEGGGGGSDLRSTAERIAAALDYLGQVPDKQQLERITAALLGALVAGWSVEGLAVYLSLGTYRPDNPVAFYLSKLSPTKLPAAGPLPAAQAPAGGVRGPLPDAARIESLTVDDVFGPTRRDTADGGMWERAMDRARTRMGDTGHQPFRNPINQDVYDEPWPGQAPARPPWCGEPDCNETDRMRDGEDASGLPFVYRCPRCHPDAARAA